MTDLVIMHDGRRGRLQRHLAHGYVVDFFGAEYTKTESVGDNAVDSIIYDHAGWVSQLEESAAMIYNMKAQSPQEMTPERWERVVHRFPPSARHAMHMAEQLFAEGLDADI
jgi:hypothetical protein